MRIRILSLLLPGLCLAPFAPLHASGAPTVFVLSGAPAAVPEATFFSFDDHSIPFRRNLHLTMVAPEKHGPAVLHRGARGAFDELRAEYYGTVIRQGGHFRMWYVGYGFADPAVRTYQGVEVHIGYAESPDGINWTKPNLGLVRFHGNTDNNIVAIEPEDYTRAYQDRNVHVLYDPADPDPTRRYKMMMYVPVSEGYCTMFPLLSADGLRWRYAMPVKIVSRSMHGQPAQPVFDASCIVLPHEHCEGGSLVRYGGTYFENGQNLNLPDGSATGRILSTFFSHDFLHWDADKAVSFVRWGYDYRAHRPGDAHVALLGDGEQVHEGAALWNRGNVLVGIYGRWEGGHTGLSQSHIDLGLISSVDAVHFHEPDPYFAFASRGPSGQWDSGGVLQGQGFQNIGDRTYFWYGSWNLTASGDKFNLATDMLESHGEIGLLTLRRDGFGYVSVRDPKTAGKHDTYRTGEGSFLSAPFVVKGGSVSLALNVDGAEAGRFAVALTDADGRALPGHDLGDFIAEAPSGVHVAGQWRGHSEIPEGGPYRLRAELKYADGTSPKLYAVYVGSQP